ncbi:MAG: hypothetical protein FJX06_16675 [Alphaproteobacteria bacterium]|nr:hypothetical protein [Alphaproteobacteria bacterium]
MIVSLSKHGGLAAGVRLRQPPLMVDAKSLPPEAARDLAAIPDAADAAARADAPPAPGEPHPDSMSYTITVERDGTTLTLKARNSAMSPPFRELRDWIERHGRRD